MISFFANLFGYVLNFLYEFVGNYGLAIILFSIIVKLLMLPISIKQQKTLKKSQKINEEMQQIQFKYRNDPEKLSQEMMGLYKREKMSPFSGCLSSILQILLLFAVFYLVRSPLTYMRKLDTGVIEKLQTAVEQTGSENNYKEIAVVDYINKLREEGRPAEENQEENQEEVQNQENTEKVENQESITTENTENTESTENNENEEFDIYDYIDEAYINMNFLGIDLSKVPKDDITNIKVLIIPILYVVTSIISIRVSSSTSNKKDKKKLISDGKEKPKEEEIDPMEASNKMMSWIMPIMSVSIALLAPLGLALYWLVNNLLMMAEKFILNRVLKDKEEEAK